MCFVLKFFRKFFVWCIDILLCMSRGVGWNVDLGGLFWEGFIEFLMEEDDVSKGVG